MGAVLKKANKEANNGVKRKRVVPCFLLHTAEKGSELDKSVHSVPSFTFYLNSLNLFSHTIIRR